MIFGSLRNFLIGLKSLLAALFLLLMTAFGSVAVFAAPGNWSQASYPIAAQKLELSRSIYLFAGATGGAVATGALVGLTGPKMLALLELVEFTACIADEGPCLPVKGPTPSGKADEVVDALSDAERALDDVAEGAVDATKGGLDDLISGGTRRSADEVNATFPEGYSAPYTPGTQVTEFVSDGNQTFVRVVSGDSPGGQWVMKASDIEGLSPQQIADKFALPEVPTGITSVTPPAGTRIRTGEVNPNFGGAGGGTQFQLLDRVNEGWADVTPLQ